MASPFEGDGVRVLLTCSCSALSPPSRLYFCRHCIKLRCPLCVSHEVNLSQKPRVMVTISKSIYILMANTKIADGHMDSFTESLWPNTWQITEDKSSLLSFLFF